MDIDRIGATKPRDILDAIGELCVSIGLRSIDGEQRKRIAAAVNTLVDHVIDYAAVRARILEGNGDV